MCIGTAQFGMNYGIANQNGQVHGNEIEAILDLARENSIDTLDTAKVYGKSEEAIGHYIKSQPGNKWSIITKINDSDIKVIDQVRDSTEKLTIQPTVVLAHSVELFLNEQFQKEVAEAREMKIITKTGVSLYSADEINQVMESMIMPEVIQLPMNILDARPYCNGLLTRMNNAGIEIHVRSAFLQGLFYLSEADLKKRFVDAVPHINRLKSIAVEASLTLAEMSLLWLISLEEVSMVAIGLDNVEQLKMHLVTLKKNTDPAIFQEALSVQYKNENILNPSLWPSMS